MCNVTSAAFLGLCSGHMPRGLHLKSLQVFNFFIVPLRILYSVIILLTFASII